MEKKRARGLLNLDQSHNNIRTAEASEHKRQDMALADMSPQ